MTAYRRRVAFLAIALSLAASSAPAQSYPSKPLRLIVGFAPGGNVDIPTRIVATRLSEILATVVVVENRPEASGNIAADIAAKAPPGRVRATDMQCCLARH